MIMRLNGSLNLAVPGQYLIIDGRHWPSQVIGFRIWCRIALHRSTHVRDYSAGSNLGESREDIPSQLIRQS